MTGRDWRDLAPLVGCVVIGVVALTVSLLPIWV